MNVEYEEFECVEDIFLYISFFVSPMKNFIPINLN